MHMIKVLKQSEVIPIVPRRFGSASHLYGGLLGVVVLVAGPPIYLRISKDNRSSKVKSEGFHTATRASSH